MKNKLKLKKGDEVIVLAGKDKGKKGKIVSPSQLDSTWLRQPKNLEIKNFKLFVIISYQ